MDGLKFNWFRLKCWYFPLSMKVFNGISQLDRALNSSVVALGNFDGLHLGHQALIRRLCELAKQEALESVVYTFHPHPATVLHPEKPHRALFSREDLIQQLTNFGVQYLILEPFNLGFSKLPAADFLQYNLLKPLHPKHIVVGEDFAFGNQRQGSIELLRQKAPLAHFHVQVITPVLLDNKIVSSTRIREAIGLGQPELATRLLGRPFSLTGEVVTGDGRGQTIGIPTANMKPTGQVLPKLGVYLTRAVVGEQSYLAVTNVGVAPTFNPNSSEVRLETQILDQNVSLVGTPLRVEFISYLREEKRFADRDALVNQIHQDIQMARQLWKTHHEVDGRRS